MAMLHPRLDLSRHRLDVCLRKQGRTVQVTTAPPDADEHDQQSPIWPTIRSR
jgi:methylmalonyl-CoA mutase cobalamin-binding subunit